MQDSRDNLVQGRTRWRRFAILMVPSAVAAAGIVVGIANGAIAASLNVSGSTFQVSADRLEGEGFTQYGGVAAAKDGAHPVAISGIDDATLYNMCQSVNVGGAPVTVTIKAGTDKDHPAHATNMLIGMDELRGNAEFTDIKIGVDAGDLGGDSGAFGQKAKHVTIKDLGQVARYTSAGTFTLNNLQLKVNLGNPADYQCVPWGPLNAAPKS
ncbi:DUF6230 family protein [Plantactinospora siamensis]|uniref:DUF6230 family protein n=1 Tax=Plantactinospora siamensis TaxID=555372 RepID=A0ABV6P5G2_9ACTN